MQLRFDLMEFSVGILCMLRHKKLILMNFYYEAFMLDNFRYSELFLYFVTQHVIDSFR